MARKGFFRRILDVFRPTKPPSVSRPEPSPVSPRIPTPERRDKRRDVIRKMVSLNPKSNARRIAVNVGIMTDAELDWTLTASVSQIQARARRDADRIIEIDGAVVPRNPWWYR